jgi:4-nitrophenyl phosphatase
VTCWVIDLDGVMWLGDRPIEGSAEAVAQLLERGDRVVFATNNSTATGEARAAQLVAHGLPGGIEVVTSADAAGGMVGTGEVALVVGGEGLGDALRSAGCTVRWARRAAEGEGAAGEAITVVVVGLDPGFDYGTLDTAAAAVRAGARMIATNTDPTFPLASGLAPGAGSLVAAVEVAAGARAEVAGKPHGPMAELLRARLGPDVDDGVMVVGDRLDTDGALAELLGWPFALVLSGATTRMPDGPHPPVDQVSARLWDLVQERSR